MEELKRALSTTVYESLAAAHIKSPKEVLRCSKTHLAQLTKLDLEAIEYVFQESAKIVLKNKCVQGHQLQPWRRISTGCPSLDLILRGGIPINNGIIEIVGCSGVGKTQVCLQLALTAQTGEPPKSVVYVCTEDVFPSKRLKQLSQELCKTHSGIPFEDNIFIEHAADTEQLKRCLFTNLPKLLSVRPLALVVIDSIAGAFRSENLNVDYFNRSQEFVSIVVKLRQLSEKHNFSIVCTNQVTQNVETEANEPCLGLAWSSVISYRLSMTRHLSNSVREIEVMFAPDLPNRSCKVVIATEGLIGVED